MSGIPNLLWSNQVLNQNHGFNKDTVANLTFWVRADNVTTGLGVTAWPDKSASGFDLDQVSANQPILLNNEINGQPAVQFVEASGTFLKRSSAAIFTGQPYTLFLVIKADALAATRVPFSWSTSNSTGIQFRFTSTPAYSVLHCLVSDHTGGTPTTAAYNVIEINRASSSAPLLKVNGTSVTIGSDASNYITGTNNISLGAQDGAALFQSCRIAECLAYNASLSAGDASTVRHYLGGRYAITVT